MNYRLFAMEVFRNYKTTAVTMATSYDLYIVLSHRNLGDIMYLYWVIQARTNCQYYAPDFSEEPHQ